MSEARANEHAPPMQSWRDFFRQKQAQLPSGNLEAIARKAMQHVKVVGNDAKGTELKSFAQTAGSRSHLLSIMRLGKLGMFPSIYGRHDAAIKGSKLILNWNLVLIEEEDQRMIVYQGVSCCDAILIPGKQLLIIICHINKDRVSDCLAILCRDRCFFDCFDQGSRRLFGGYLVGHSRPYHCLYDSLLGLQAAREAGALAPGAPFFSRRGESFFALDESLGLREQHHIQTQEDINDYCDTRQSYLLYVGYWVKEAKLGSINRQLAENLDQQLLEASEQYSTINELGALTALVRCRPLIWIGITGQKRSWVEQVDGTVQILNHLHQIYPSMGVVFDGWTSPLHPDSYHKQEARRDDRVISRICRQLRFSKKNRIGVLAGQLMLDKIRVGMEVDAFIANYTTGSMNIARICQKPGVGHMSQAMMASRGPHIHHHTVEVESQWVIDEHDPSKPTGYINYSIPWQVIYNSLIPLLSGLDVPQSAPLQPIDPPQEIVKL